jgi:hypothetical protein
VGCDFIFISLESSACSGKEVGRGKKPRVAIVGASAVNDTYPDTAPLPSFRLLSLSLRGDEERLSRTILAVPAPRRR